MKRLLARCLVPLAVWTDWIDGAHDWQDQDPLPVDDPIPYALVERCTSITRAYTLVGD